MISSARTTLFATALALGGLLTTPSASAQDAAPATKLEAASQTEKETTYTTESGMELTRLLAGECWIGSSHDEPGHKDNEAPRHKATFSRDFFIGIHEVTQGQWMELMNTAPWSGKDFFKSGADYPASYVSHAEAVEFCRLLSEAEGRTFRLPSAAEWEYACRAGTETPFHYGDDAEALVEYDWFYDNCRMPGRLERYPHKVGQKKPNPWGLYDMHGNVREWVIDWFGQYDKGNEVDPVVDQQGHAQFRTVRGGSWFAEAKECRSAVRDGQPESKQIHFIGFRVVMEVPEPEAEGDADAGAEPAAEAETDGD